MWIYEKKLEYPVKVSSCNPTLASLIIEQFGGADGELAAALRYLTQVWTMPIPQAKAILTDIGTEELAHWEMIGTMVYQLVKIYLNQKLLERLLLLIMLIMAKVLSHIMQQEHPLQQHILILKVTPLQIFMKIWRPSKKPGQLMNI